MAYFRKNLKTTSTRTEIQFQVRKSGVLVIKKVSLILLKISSYVVQTKWFFFFYLGIGRENFLMGLKNGFKFEILAILIRRKKKKKIKMKKKI